MHAHMHMHAHTLHTRTCVRTHYTLTEKDTLKSLSEIFLPFHFELGIVLKIKAEVIYLQTVYLTFVPPTDGIFLT